MKWFYTFLLEGSWRTHDIIAHNPHQAKKLAERQTEKVVLDVYQTCPLGGVVYGGWKSLLE